MTQHRYGFKINETDKPCLTERKYYEGDYYRNIKYTLDGDRVIKQELTSDNYSFTAYYMYDESGRPIAFTLSENGGANEYYFYESNIFGDITAIYDEDGNVVAQYKYDAWGNFTATTSKNYFFTDASLFKYRGYIYDWDTGFYYLQSRYYDPEVGRFISSDGQLNGGLIGYNMYAYCINNPVMLIDPTGNAPDWSVFIGGALLLTIGVLTVTAVVLTGGTCVPAVALAYAVLGTAGILTAAIGASEVYESFTGDNPIREYYGDDVYETVKYTSLTVISMGPAIIEIGSAVSVCFVSGTLVETEKGGIPIEEITTGMMVYAHNPETGETELKEVVRVFRNEASELVHVYVNGEEIVCTNEHPFYSPVKVWTAACQLRAGDILVTVNGEYVIVEKVEHELLESPVTVYNFEVEDFHTYFVSDSAILVHNDCGITSPNQMQKQVERGQAPKGVIRVDNPKVPGQQPHVHFSDGTALNIDGSVHDAKNGIPNLTNEIRIWLEKNGWRGN